MILYFANRQMEILGKAATHLRKGFVITEDLKIEDVESGVAVFDCKIGFNKSNRKRLEKMTAAGNYILRQNDGETEFYTIIDREIDTKRQEVYVYAEDAGLDLINEIAEAYEATEAHTAEWYINKWITDSGFEIGINEIPESSSRKLSWEGEATVTERLASIATQFGGYEISFSFAIKGMEISKKYVNIYAERGKNTEEQLRLNRDIDRIIIKESVANLATALRCTGGMLEDGESCVTLQGFEYDDGNFYVSADGVLRSRNAVAKWSRYVWNKEPNQLANYEGHIVRSYSYDTLNQATLCAHAVTKLKEICDTEVNYEIDIKKLPDNIKIGDRVNIVDEEGELYLSSRILKLETSVTEETQTATIGEHLIKEGDVSLKVEELAAQFTETAKSAAKAQAVADAAKTAAASAKTQADNAQTKADEAAQAAAQATADAADAQAAVEIAQSKAETAYTKAETAQSTAEAARAEANTAKATADAAKLDAAKANEDIANLGNELDTLSQTMEADYARKTDLTETEAHLQTQITQNAAEIASNASKIVVIDETANNAAAQAEVAQKAAETAQAQANTATADATAAQKAANTAQSKADTAKAEASAAQVAADDAEAKAQQAATDLATAKSNLAVVTSRVDATEEEIAAAEAAVAKAQAAADSAADDAAAAQSTADTAKANAAAAQTAANNAKTAADNAQKAADDAQEAADAAQEAVDALAVRVTTAETSIKQNSEAIELRATKTEVTNTLSGYYSKTETEAKIKVEADKISSQATKIDELGTRMSTVEQTAEGLTVQLSEAENNITTAQSTANAAKTAADNAAKTATNFLSYDSINGLLIGNKTSGSWVGSRAQILPSAFNILDSSGNTLASYGTNTIELGKNSISSVISMCGGAATIKYVENDTIYGDRSETEFYANQVAVVGDDSAELRVEKGGASLGYARQAQVLASDCFAGLWAKSCDNLGSDGTGTFSSSYLYVDGTSEGAIYGLAGAINLEGRSEVILTAGSITLKGAVTIGGSLSITNNITASSATLTNIELHHATPYIDFHFGKSTADYTSRIIESSSGVLEISNSLYVKKKITVQNEANGGQFGIVNTSGTTLQVLHLTSANDLSVGGGLYNAAAGNTTVYAGKHTILKIPGDAVGLYTSTDSNYSGYFKPNTNGKCTLGSSGYRWYAVYAANASIQTSDRREKENIMPFGVPQLMTVSTGEEDILTDIHSELFDRLQPVQYNMINGSGKTCFGLIAQDVVEAMREVGYNENELDLVHHDYWTDEESGEEKESYGLAYTNLLAMLIHEVQKLKSEVAALKAAC